VESLLLGLPVPGIFFSKEEKTQKLLVIDGQQRLKTLQFFYDGIWEPTGREFALRDVQSRFERVTYKTLEPEDKLRLSDSILHATVMKQDVPTDDNSSIYYMFERLNTGGSQLLAQEIRCAIYHGEFNELLRVLNDNQHWRAVFGRPINKRMRDQELILRFLALLFNGEHYEEPMKLFLNKFMSANMSLNRIPRKQLSEVFGKTIEVVHEHLGAKVFRPVRALNAAVLDAVMVGIAKRLERGPIKRPEALQKVYEDLLNNKEFATVTDRSTASLASVGTRLKLATHAFASVS
jgi:hypothetical protein